MQIISYIFILSFLKFQFRSADDEISKQDFFCRIPVLGLGLRVDFTFAWDNNNKNNDNNDKNNPHPNFLKGTVLLDKEQGLGIRDNG